MQPYIFFLPLKNVESDIVLHLCKVISCLAHSKTAGFLCLFLHSIWCEMLFWLKCIFLKPSLSQLCSWKGRASHSFREPSVIELLLAQRACVVIPGKLKDSHKMVLIISTYIASKRVFFASCYRYALG